MSKKKIGLVPKLIIGIIAGILIGSFAPEFLVKVLVTASSLFSAFLKFVIPFIIIGFVTAGIADLATGAGKLLGVTTGIAYGSTIVAGTLAFIVASLIFPSFIDPSVASQIGDPEAGMLEPIFTIPLSPMVDVTAAIVFSFTMGLGISALRNNDKGEILYNLFQEFQEIITKVLSIIIIPLLPIYIAGTFANITYAGQVWNILSIFWRVYLVVIPLHIVYLVIQFTTAGFVTGKNPLKMLKNQIPGYLTAVGTQSSAATIPVNVECAKNNGVSKEIREFCVPLCATIHLSGSIISVTSFAVAVLMMNGMDHGFSTVFPFILMLGIAMVAAPGAPGGAIMSALPFLPMIGIPSDGGLASLMIALYLTQDSFGTAANVSGDNAIAAVVDHLNKKWSKKADNKVA
ncbi:dicarboxylate/amino acid:cation symporter [Romboutsia timonensis]|uniref:dicarboxylate/amino acid:cation symporter n=1 Tax=Romboutsia timonensis TaxID=1776391 RepID=UPI0025921C5E|nr:dicarboxylate/amino acid:cation symporter [Romboutsia timonensis]MCI6667003.1 dicarboxylate/amino acid:cation symporter [Romboutsia timonensis]MDY3958854.1 dicarboxylate/amino acid:cation symporter [Romboutsia timonensis]